MRAGSRSALEREAKAKVFFGLPTEVERDHPLADGHNIALDDLHARRRKCLCAAEIEAPESGLARRPYHDGFDLVRAGIQKRSNRRGLPIKNGSRDTTVDQDPTPGTVIRRRKLDAGFQHEL